MITNNFCFLEKPLICPNTLGTPVVVVEVVGGGSGMPRPTKTSLRFKMKIDLVDLVNFRTLIL